MSEKVEIKFTNGKPNVFVNGYPIYHPRSMAVPTPAIEPEDATTDVADPAEPTATAPKE